MPKRRNKILAVASGGGHWIELLRVTHGIDNAEIVYVTVRKDYGGDVPGARLRVVNDATRWNRIAVLFLALRVLIIMLRERPAAVLTTGAAPGYFAVRFGKWLGARTIWLDSIANVDELSMSGRLAGKYADLWLTQWPHLAAQNGPEYAGAVL